jgi:hypothetical protein
MPSRIGPLDERAPGTARRSLALIVAALVLAAGAGLAADSHTRTVQGSVTAQDDSLVDGAVVYLKNTKTLQIRSFFTQKDGAYRFQDLSPDIDYELKAENHGTWSNPHPLSSFDTRKLITINLKLSQKK